MIEITSDNLDLQKYVKIISIIEIVTGQRIQLPEGVSREEFITRSDWTFVAALISRMIEPILHNSIFIAQLKSRRHLSRLVTELDKLNRGLKISIELPDGTQFQLNRQNAQLLLQAIQNHQIEG